MSDIIKEAFNNIEPAARERVRIKTNIMDDQTLREKALELAVKAAECEGYHPDKIIDIANQFYEFLKGDECKPYEGLSEGWFKRMNPSGNDIDIACEILNKANITDIETHYEITTQEVKINTIDFRVVGNTLIIGS